jgi:hypothetical protein
VDGYEDELAALDLLHKNAMTEHDLQEKGLLSYCDYINDSRELLINLFKTGCTHDFLETLCVRYTIDSTALRMQVVKVSTKTESFTSRLSLLYLSAA